ncbi:MAG: DinB family protein [Candidatus Hodarchaeota archaeon]
MSTIKIDIEVSLVEKLIETLKTRRIGVLFILKMVPLDLWDWSPTPSIKMRTVSELANHIACTPLTLLESFRGNIPNEETYNALEKNNMPLNAQGLTKLYENSLKELISYLEEHIEDAHEKNIKFFYQEHNTSIYQEAFDDIGHQWFHLGQLFIYLRQNNIQVDMGAYYGYKDPDTAIPPNE